MGEFKVKTKEKAPTGVNKSRILFTSGNAVRRGVFVGMSEALNMLQVNFGCEEGNEGGGGGSECLILKNPYLSTKLEGGGDVETLIRNGKSFYTAWTNPVGPNPETMKAMLQAEYGTREKRVEKLRIKLSMAYILVLGQCT